MEGLRGSGPRWSAITVRQLLLSPPASLHASFNGFFTLLVSIAGNIGPGRLVHHFSRLKCSFPRVQGGWCTTRESELNAAHL